MNLVFRADSLATLYFFHPLRRLAPVKHRIPILMYHSVSDSADNGKHPYYQTVTTPEAFARQMQFLHRNGYSVLDLDRAVRYMEAPDPAVRPVVITFDDGFRDFHRNAFPLLNRYDFTATMYLPTAYIGSAAKQFKGVECMTWDEVRELRREGIDFGSHTVTHPQLKSISHDQVCHEVRSSKETIEDELGSPVKSFAYPYAFPEGNVTFTQKLRGILEETGFENGVSTIIGSADRTNDKFFLKRLPINSCDDDRLLKAKLDGAYDWLHSIQYASKWISRGTAQ